MAGDLGSFLVKLFLCCCYLSQLLLYLFYSLDFLVRLIPHAALVLLSASFNEMFCVADILRISLHF